VAKECVLTQAFPVICCHDHDGSVKELARAQVFQQLPNPHIEVGDLPIIEVGEDFPRPWIELGWRRIQESCRQPQRLRDEWFRKSQEATPERLRGLVDEMRLEVVNEDEKRTLWVSIDIHPPLDKAVRERREGLASRRGFRALLGNAPRYPGERQMIGAPEAEPDFYEIVKPLMQVGGSPNPGIVGKGGGLIAVVSQQLC
jgi:hypothetical protein